MTVEQMPLVRAGTDDRFAAIYLRHYRPMVRLAYVTTGSVSAAEDLTQDAFAELYRRFDRLTDPAAYLRRIVVSRTTSWVRRRMVERRHARPESTEAAAPVGPETVAVRAALARLSPRHRAAIFLRFYLDLSESAIAESLGCRPGTVKSLLHRGLRTLREHLDEH